jgi:putative ABC transport system permease protein
VALLLKILAAGVSEAATTVRMNPLRSSLAALAVAAAVATTAVVQTALDGVARSAREASARAFGSDTFVIARLSAGTLSRRELLERIERNRPITRSDLRFLERAAEGRVQYAATAQRAADVVRGGATFESAMVNGTQSTLPAIRDVGIATGRFFTQDEDAAGAPVAVLGRAVADELFPTVDPLGRMVRIAGRAFLVVGVQLRQGTAGGVSLDRYVWIPLIAFERAFGAPESLQVFARAMPGTSTSEAEAHARISMRGRRGLAPGQPDTFDIITPEASRGFVAALTERVGLAAPPISLMALVAAVIVVANTTLVSVTTRTREIGVRRAVGARRVQVLVETLAESTLVSLLGGAVGLAIGSLLLSSASRLAGIDLPLAWPTALGSLAAAGGSGLVAGWYPASRASGTDVIAALRSE